ncbi:MAG: hypothetical protein ACRCTZ_05670 [Sarcina sp.]
MGINIVEFRDEIVEEQQRINSFIRVQKSLGNHYVGYGAFYLAKVELLNYLRKIIEPITEEDYV